MLHPLINKVDSAHYDREDGRSAIEELEKQLTIREMIGFCEGNIFKYKFRMGEKDPTAKEYRKIKTYENYLKLLHELVYKLKNDTYYVNIAYKLCNIHLLYK